jgi:hypothetical protein
MNTADSRAITPQGFIASIEPLEPRIAPASLLSPGVVTYTDADGDSVTVKVNKGSLGEHLTFDTPFDSNGPQQLEKIDLTGPLFAHVNLTVTVTQGIGDGRADVGYIDATGIDLGSVIIPGNLGKIVSGDAATRSPGLRFLSVHSLGFGSLSDTAPDLLSTVTGSLGTLKVAGDIRNATLLTIGGPDASIGKIIIGGSLIGGATDRSGYIGSEGGIGALQITHDLQGGAGISSGEVSSGGTLGSAIVHGSVVGGSNDDSGRIRSTGNLGVVRISGDLNGSSGYASGTVFSAGRLGLLTLGRSLHGGLGASSGHIEANDGIGMILISGNVIGGGAEYSGSIRTEGSLVLVSVDGFVQGGAGPESGRIRADGAIVQAKIGGGLEGGGGNFSGSLSTGTNLRAVTIGGSIVSGVGVGSGSILSDGAIGKIVAKENITGTSSNAVIISAAGPATPTGKKDLAIASLSVSGDLSFAQVLAGYSPDGTNLNADAQIGFIKVTGNWTGGNIVAGAESGPDGAFGTADDTKGSGAEHPGIVATITSIIIGGQTKPAGSGLHFGFTAEAILTLKIGNVAVSLAHGAGNDHLVPAGTSGDLFLQEV